MTLAKWFWFVGVLALIALLFFWPEIEKAFPHDLHCGFVNQDRSCLDATSSPYSFERVQIWPH